MASNVSPLPRRKRPKLSPLNFNISPTLTEPDRNWASYPNLPMSHACPPLSSLKNYPLLPDCGPYINLEEHLKTRSLLHQSRLKSASTKTATSLVYKYHARSVSELYNLCTADEWASLCYSSANYNRDITVALDIYIKDSLECQRRDRWEWLISYQSFLPDEETEILKCLLANKIDPIVFMTQLKIILDCSEHKKNTFKLWGIPDSGKSLLSQLICKNFICSFVSNHGSEQEFFFSNFLNKSILSCEELYVTTATVEDYKSILGGAPIDIPKKFNEKQLMSRTPIILTSNYKLFGRGHLTPVDEQALQSRCFSFEFICIYKPRVTVTAPALAHLLHNLYNKDILFD